MRWIVTREPDDAEPLLQALPDAVCVPAITRRNLPWPEWPVLPGPVLYMVSSSYVARQLPDDGVPAAALLPKTAALLGKRAVLEVAGGALELARAVAVTTWCARYPTSDLADTGEIRALLGERIAVAVVYETLAPPSLHADMARVIKHGYGLYVASPSAVSHLLSAPLDRPARVVALGRSTVERYNLLKPDNFPVATLVHDEAAAVETMR